jgi:hypothetical protein
MFNRISLSKKFDYNMKYLNQIIRLESTKLKKLILKISKYLIMLNIILLVKFLKIQFCITLIDL